MPVKINGSTSGSVTLAAPATGSDVTLTLPTLGFGKVLQVVYGSTTTSTTVASTTFTDTGLSASITPNSTSSKILVIAFQQFLFRRTANEQGHALRLLRDTTTVFNPDPNGYDAGYMQASGASAITLVGRSPLIYLDSPSTTSATTYKIQGRVWSTANSGSVSYQDFSAASSIALVEVAA